jgi:hypothetical protein
MVDGLIAIEIALRGAGSFVAAGFENHDSVFAAIAVVRDYFFRA